MPRRQKVDYDSHQVVSIAPGQSTSFGWLRVAEPITLFDWSGMFGDSPYIWTNKANGPGSEVTNSFNDSAVLLTCSPINGSSIIRQSKKYCHYQPGKSQLILMSSCFISNDQNTIKRIGYYDDLDGVFFEQSYLGATPELAFVVRKDGVDTRITQDNWNIDKMNGTKDSSTNDSHINIDVSKSFILGISLEWLGVGTVNFGFFVDGEFILCHQQHHANYINSVYMTTAKLPVRAEIVNSGGTGLFLSGLKMICSTVISEGGYNEKQGQQFSCSTGTTLKTITTRVPVLSIRADQTGQNNVLNRAHIIPKNIEVFSAGSQSVFYEIIFNPTLTGPNFNKLLEDYTISSYDVSSTNLSGGVVIDSGYIPASNNNKHVIDLSLFNNLTLNYDHLNGAGDILTVALTRVGSTGTSDCAVSATIQEIR